ncbi:MAG: TIGR03619 family F420-dependent LLM class oxidoreductase [Nitrososphaeraceae archaeon]|nr:TIGR03619 family F420-dependent LLM class oxidoreductase [Nitrososphaeraceae archaeon]
MGFCMKVGLFLPQVGEHVTTENILYIATEAEKEGIDSVWVLDRLLWPIKPQTPYAASPDGSLPVEYQNVLDPLTTLTYVAAVTEQISLGTSVIDIFFQNPIVLSKRITTLDILSDGRVIAGLGIGWSKDEYEVSGIPYKDRGTRADEYLQVLKKIWTDAVVEFKGQFYNIPASKIGPKPVQKPHPPILLGGFSPKTFSRIVNYANGWIGVAGFGPLEQLEQAINGLKESARKADKDPSKISIYMGSYPNVLESPSNQIRTPMTGTIEQIGSDIEQIKAMGTDHIIFGHLFSSVGRDMKKMVEVTKELARFAK